MGLSYIIAKCQYISLTSARTPQLGLRFLSQFWISLHTKVTARRFTLTLHSSTHWRPITLFWTTAMTGRHCQRKLSYHRLDTVGRSRLPRGFGRENSLSRCRGLNEKCRIVLRNNLFQNAAHSRSIIVPQHPVYGLIYHRNNSESWVVFLVEDLYLGSLET